MDNQNSIIYLPNRKIISVFGEDASQFLQGIITNDIKKTKDGLTYSLMLTPQGKFLFDFFIWESDSKFFIDICSFWHDDFIKKLTMYRLRAKVSWQDEDLKVFSVNSDEDCHFVDPRDSRLGYRLYTREMLASEGEEVYHKMRIEYGVAEGYSDLTSGEGFPLEYNMANFSAIDYDKGCYVGQELVSRTTYRGTVRKSVFTVWYEDELTTDAVTIIALQNGKEVEVGKMLSRIGNKGLALLKFTDIEEDATLLCAGKEIYVNMELIKNLKKE